MKTKPSGRFGSLPSLTLLYLVFSCLHCASAQFSSIPREDFWVPGAGGFVIKAREANGVVCLAGSFDKVLPSPPSGVEAFDIQTGLHDPDFPKVNGFVYAAVSDGNSGWYLGGDFPSVDGVAVANLTHILPDKTVDANWTPNPDGTVLALAVAENVLYVGGEFSRIDSQPRQAIAALDLATGKATAWNPDPKPFEFTSLNFSHLSVRALAVSSDTVYVGGQFSNIGGQQRNFLAALDARSGTATPWNPNPSLGTEGLGNVDRIILAGERIYVTGAFTNIADQARNWLAAFSLTNGELEPWNPNPSADSNFGWINSFALSRDAIYVGGQFDQIGGQRRDTWAALDPVTGQAIEWDVDVHARQLTGGMIVAGDVLYMGGEFADHFNPAFNVVGLNTKTGQATQWLPLSSAGGPLALSGSTLLASQFFLFSSAGAPGLSRPLLAAMDFRTGKPLAWNPVNQNGHVQDIALSSDTVYLAGQSLTADDLSPAKGLIALDIRTGDLQFWNPLIREIFEEEQGDASFSLISFSAGSVYASGQLFRPPNSFAYVLVSLDAETGATNWVRRTDKSTSSLAVSGGRIYVGGDFTDIGGVKRNHLAALDAANGAVTDWNPDPSGYINSIAVAGNTIYVSGWTGFGAGPPGYLAAVDAISGRATHLDVGPVGDLAIFGDVLYVAGSFSRIGGQDRSGLAAIDLTTGLVTDWNPNPNHPLILDALSISVSEKGVYVTGGFTVIGGKFRPRFAVFPLSGSPQIISNPKSQHVSIGQTAQFSLQVSGEEPKHYQWSLNGTNIIGGTSAVLVIPNSQVSDSGEYSVAISNALGWVNSRPARLIVVESPIIPVSIPDPGLNAAIRQTLSKPAGPLTAQDLLRLTSLNAASRGVSSLEGLGAAHNLITLNLNVNQLTNGNALAGLTNLIELQLGYNYLTDFSFLSGLTSLTSLYLYNNQLTSLTLPAGLTNLRTLALYGNRLTDFSFLSGLPSLNHVFLDGSLLSSLTLPTGLTNLTFLSLSYNYLMDFSFLSGLPSLTSLNLGYNELTSLTLPFGLTNLTELVLDGNHLTSLTLPADLTNLTSLSLQGNQLTNFSLPAGLTSFTALYLNDNQLSSLALPAGLTNLTFLSLSYNYLTDLSFLSGLPSLASLNLGYNELTSLMLPFGLTNLTELVLDGNHLTSLTLPADLTNLTSLSLQGNQLTNFSLPAGLTSFTALYLNDNQLSSLALPAGLTHLTTLLLSGNQLTNLTLPADLTSLTTLNLGDQPLLKTFTLSEQLAFTGLADQVAFLKGQGVSVYLYPSPPEAEVSIPDASLNEAIRAALAKPAGPLTVQDLLSLKNLDASGKGVSSLEGLGAAHNLTNLNLARNQLWNFTLPAGLTNLAWLGLYSSLLRNLTLPADLTSLTTLDLGGNQLTSLTLPATLTSLTTLYLLGNELTSLTLPPSLTSLTTLSALHNQLTNLTLPASLTSLTMLDLRENQLTNFSFLSGLTSLTSLFFDTQLTDFSFLSGLTNLTWLALYNNQLTSLTLPEGLTSLTTLILDNYQLTNLTLAAGLMSLNELDLRSSPLNTLVLSEELAATGLADEVALLKVQGVSVHVYPAPPSEEVSIPDPGLNAAIRQTLGKPAGPLTAQDLLSLTSLDAASRGVSDLEGLGAALNLTSLYLSFNELTSFTLPAGLTRLTTLYLNNNQLTNLTLPSGLTALATLDLGDNQLTRLTLPADLTSLTTLDLEENPLTSFSFLSGMTNLTSLSLDNNQLTSLSLPAGLGSLTSLNLGGNQLTNFSFLNGLTNLTSLNLDNNRLTKLTLPADLTTLTTLDLRENPLRILVLSEQLAATGLADEVALLRDQGVSVSFHPSPPVESPVDQDIFQLQWQRQGAELQLTWPGSLRKADGSTERPYFELQRSVDLQHWQPLGERQRAAEATPGQLLGVTLSMDEPHAFYRLLSVQPPNLAKLGAGGAEVFGYGAAFAQELQRIGQISTAEFAGMFPNAANYLSGISWDPTTASNWSQFNADIFRLNQAELAVFKKNGFVVSERLGSGSFAGVFYGLWHNDLPVFVSTDAILQAWHRTYDALLEEIEETYLFNTAQQMLDAMAAGVPDAFAGAGGGVLKDSILDADYFLAVARSLLAGTNGPVASLLGQTARVAETLAEIQAEQLTRKPDFFGQCRVVDFSQFKVRGHYTHSERLGRYFRCAMWLGRIDLAVAGGPFDRGCGPQSASPRELGTAIVLWRLLNESGQFTTWLNFDRVIQTFVGWTDSMDFAQLGDLLAAASIQSLADVPDLARLQKLQSDILDGDLGVQNIRSDYFVSPLGPEQIQLPRSFLVFGQKFVPDSWAFSQTVYDSILWLANGETNKIQRRVPSALDAAFSVLGNNQVVPDLVARMTNSQAAQSLNHAEKWRDGLPYQHNLAAVRGVVDAQQSAAWDSNIYMGWLAALRELSAPTSDAAYPEAMRTRAWAMKTLNTQLASWTQLRHDTILYAKQSYTAGFLCYYPAGFVEPRVAFWQRLRAIATRAAELIASLPYAGAYSLVTTDGVYEQATGRFLQVSMTNSIPMTTIQANQVRHLRSFADTVGVLQTLAEKELAQQCFNSDEELFVRNLIQDVGMLKQGSGGVRKYDGWYPRLFYRAVHFASLRDLSESEAYFQENLGVNAADQLVADVHTDVPSPDVGDPGSVLHEGIGRVNLLMIAVENGSDRMVFAGPVLSHYEFELVGEPRRLSDEEWQGIQYPSLDPAVVDRIEGLAPPGWTQSYLVPQPPQ